MIENQGTKTCAPSEHEDIKDTRENEKKKNHPDEDDAAAGKISVSLCFSQKSSSSESDPSHSAASAASCMAVNPVLFSRYVGSAKAFIRKSARSADLYALTTAAGKGQTHAVTDPHS